MFIREETLLTFGISYGAFELEKPPRSRGKGNGQIDGDDRCYACLRAMWSRRTLRRRKVESGFYF
jgi:hypothetical protein